MSSKNWASEIVVSRFHGYFREFGLIGPAQKDQRWMTNLHGRIEKQIKPVSRLYKSRSVQNLSDSPMFWLELLCVMVWGGGVGKGG